MFFHAQGFGEIGIDLISNFNISFKSPRNNSIKPFQFYLIVLSLHIAFSLGSGNEKTYNNYLKAARV